MPESESARKSPVALPKNLEAEQGLLGSLQFDNRLFERLPLLTPGMFFDPVHGRIFQAIAELIRAGRVADGVALKAKFAQDGGLQEIGGPGYLADLLAAAAPEYATIDYANQIRESHQRREIFSACQRLAGSALKPDEDVAELIRRAERELGALIAGGRNWISVREAGEGIVSGLASPAPKGIRTGLVKIDRLLGGGFYAPDFVVIAGRPAMGKTALADNLAANIASAGRVVGFFSMEMDPEQIAARLLSRRSAALGPSFAYTDLRSFSHRPKPHEVEHLVERLPDTLLIDPTGAQTLAGIEASARNMRRELGDLDAILVDYLQLMREGRRENRTQEISEITAGLKSLAKRLNTPVIALSQLSRAVENRADKRPQLADLRESGSIEQDADIVLFVYREHYYLERATPTAQDGEDRADFASRMVKHEQRLRDTANVFELFTGKNRHGPGGTETLYCDLAMDVIADERTPHADRLRQDGVS